MKRLKLKRTKSKILKRKQNPNHHYLVFRISGMGPQDELVFASGPEKNLYKINEGYHTNGLLFTDEHLDSMLAFLVERHIAGEGGFLMKKVLGKFDFKKALIAYDNNDYDNPNYDLGYQLSTYERTINDKAAESILYNR